MAMADPRPENQAVFCYFSFYFFAIFLDLHASILRDSARSYIASLLFLLCYFCYCSAAVGSPRGCFASEELTMRQSCPSERAFRATAADAAADFKPGC